MTIPPKVSVCMITYNHENYIREAIEGVLMQECDFEVELIVANDCSTDTTDKVIHDILQIHPRSSWIKYIKHNVNIGMMPNFVNAMQQCQGKYIALCEGDDYWTDPLKLQKQVDFLEENEENVLTYHNVSIIDKKGVLLNESKTPEIYKRDFSSIELMKSEIFICSMSLVFRNILKNLPLEFLKVKNGDVFLTSYLGQFGAGKYIENIGGMYRIHGGGVWSTLDDKSKLESKKNTFFQLHKYYDSIKKSEISNYYLNKYKSIPSNKPQSSFEILFFKFVKRGYKKIKNIF